MPAPASPSSATPSARIGRLLALLRWPGSQRAPAAKRPAATLAIAGIPERIAALPTRMNTAITGPDDTHFRRWQRQLLRSLLASAPAVFVMADTPQAMAKLLAVPDLQEALAQGRIRPWILPLDAQNHIAQRRLPDLLSELHTAGLRPHHALLCTNAAGLLLRTRLVHLERMSSQWVHWARQRNQASVWCFTVEAGQPHVRSIISALARCFLYAAHLEVHATEPALVLERWDSPQGALFNTRYGLEPTPNGLLRANGSIVRGSAARLAQAPDAEVVYVTQACLNDLRTLPPHWKPVDSWQAAENAVQSAIGATVLLDAGTPEQFEALVTLIHRLRSAHPPTLKIAVLETTAKLRSHHERALLQLGANEVFYAEMRMARIVRHVQKLRDQVYLRDLPADWKAVMADFLPVPEQGYQPPPRFLELVRDMLERAQRQDLNHALVQLHLLPHVSHGMALKAYCGTRSGDLLTADAQSLWLFLYTCREVDLDPTIERLFSPSSTNLFSSQTTHCQLPGIAQQLSLLLEEDEQHPLPDYSQMLGAAPPAPREMPPAPAALPAPAAVQPLPDVPASPMTVPAAALTWQARPLGKFPLSQERAP
ncbi:MAG: BcsE family c-di-GMP-binding protein [Comamonas sp.]